MLSTAIGSLPIGMYALGELAEAVGPSTAIIGFNMVGLALLLGWTTWHPEVRRIR